MQSDNEKKVYEALDELGIAYTRIEHPPVYTVAEEKSIGIVLLALSVRTYSFATKRGITI